MSTTTKFVYSSEATIACGLDGLTNSSTAGRSSAVVDNTSNLYLDALVSVTVQTIAGSLGSIPYLLVYAYAWSEGQSTHYTDNASGSSGAFTFSGTLPQNMKLLQVISYNVAANTVLYSSPFSVALAFGGILPPKWGLAVLNITGLTLAGTATQDTANICSYVGVQIQSV